MSDVTLVLGGARSGKSRHAQELAARMASGGLVVYLATAQAGDDEMEARIARHRQDRPSSWRTIEEPLDAAWIVRNETEAQVILIDCLTFFVTNHLLRSGDAASCEADVFDVEGAELAVTELAAAVCAASCPIIIVSNEVGMGLVPETPLGRVFRDVAGRANQQIAAVAGHVIFMVAGLPMTVKAP